MQTFPEISNSKFRKSDRKLFGHELNSETYFLLAVHLNSILHSNNINSYNEHSFWSLIESYNYFSRKIESWFVSTVRRNSVN